MKSSLKSLQTEPQPRISVFITSFNQKDYLREAIDSVLNQTLPPWEIIVAHTPANCDAATSPSEPAEPSTESLPLAAAGGPR